MKLSVVIPTYGRGQILLDTLLALRELPEPGAFETLVIDQTPRHEPDVAAAFSALEAEGALRWIRLDRPSIPRAMNRGLLEARGDLVLFLDDDVLPARALFSAHRDAHALGRGDLVAGQVLQPGESPEPLEGDQFAFRSATAQTIGAFMGGNFSISPQLARRLRGFDESFVRAAYRFEADFADRALAGGCRIWFEPNASIRHLRAPRGGTRSYGSHLTTAGPGHAVGEYYYLLRHRPPGFVGRIGTRPWRAIRTRHHLSRPWWIPVTLWAETCGLAWAASLALRPARLLEQPGRGERVS